MANFVNSKFVLNNEEQSEEQSEKIGRAHAIQLMNNYKSNRIAELKNRHNEELDGFYFDASDILDAAKNLTGPKDKIYIALAKNSPTNKVEDYTLVIAGVQHRENADGENKNFFIHHDVYHPWFEFSKPCPDKCPREDG